MSGPTAATYSLEAAVIAAALDAILGVAEAIQGHADERQRRAGQEDERRAEAAGRRQAGLAARQALRDSIAREAARWQRLAAVQQTLTGAAAGAVPADLGTAEDDVGQLNALLVAWRAANAGLDAALGQLAATAGRPDLAATLAELTAAAPGLDGQLASFEAQSRLAAALSPDLLAERRALVARLLDRLAGGDRALVEGRVADLVAELMQTTSAARVEALASELRLAVEKHNEAANTTAAAVVLEQSLRDLGYDVDGIAETLFVEGGVAHIRKPGWEDYFVRVRVDAARTAINFNVVRPGTAGDDRRQQDMLAEERWCSEFPVLQKTLAARGLNLAVTRMLAAGAVPVQVVDAASLPAVAGEEERRDVRQPKALSRP